MDAIKDKAMLAYGIVRPELNRGKLQSKCAENISDAWFVSWVKDSGAEEDSTRCIA